MTSSDYPIRKHFKCCPFCTSCITAQRFRSWEGIFHTVHLARWALLLPAERRRHAERDALPSSRTFPSHHCFFSLLPCPQSSRSCGWDQYWDPSMQVKPLGSISPGPPHRLSHPQDVLCWGGSLCKQNLAKVPVQIKPGQDFISSVLILHAAVDLSGEKTTEAFCFTARWEGRKEKRTK